MTAPQPVPPFDQGNQLLGEGPAQLTTAAIPTAAGQRMLLTIRTPSTTVTVLLAKEDARSWGRSILAAASQVSDSGLVVANGHLPKGAP